MNEVTKDFYSDEIVPSIEVPKIKSKWRHYNGIKYKVILIVNEENNEKYPITVIYKGKNGKAWSRPLNDWHRSFTEIVKSNKHES